MVKIMSGFFQREAEALSSASTPPAPPAYEVNFRDVRDEEFGTIVYEDEIELAPERVVQPERAAAGVA